MNGHGGIAGGIEAGKLVALGSRGLVVLDLESGDLARYERDAGRYSSLHPLEGRRFAFQSSTALHVRSLAIPEHDELSIEYDGEVRVSGDRSLLPLLGWAVPVSSQRYLLIEDGEVRLRPLDIEHWIADPSMDVPPAFRPVPGTRRLVAWSGKGAGPVVVVDARGTPVAELPIGGGAPPAFTFLDEGSVMVRFDEVYGLDPDFGVRWSLRLKDDRSGSFLGAVCPRSDREVLLCWYGRRWRREPAPHAAAHGGAVLRFDLVARAVKAAAWFPAWPTGAVAIGDRAYARTWAEPDTIVDAAFAPDEWPRYAIRPPGTRDWF